MNKTGFKILLIDKNGDSIGGDCLNYGCVPSKALIYVSRLANNAKLSERFGLTTSGEIDIKKVMDYVKSKQNIIRKHENAEYFRKQGIDVELGSVQFTSPKTIEINGKKLSAKNFILATGSRPRELKIPGSDKVDILTNETIFDIKILPKKLLVIGGGPIGIELGQALQRLGSQVKVVEVGSQFLPKENKEIASILQEKLKVEGIEFFFNTQPKEFVNANEIIIEQGGVIKNLQFDAILVCIGRMLNIEGLGLEKAGIVTNNKRIKVDKYLRTTNKNVFVCGDLAGSYQFTHAAELHAQIIIKNFFSPIKKKVSYENFSWVTFTDPEIATFGLQEDEPNKKRIKFEKIDLDFKNDDRAIVDEFTKSKIILFIGKNKILGGSIIAPNAGELAQELILSNSANISINKIFEKIYPYPTAGRINKSVISQLFRKKLNDRTKKILKFFYR
jgi:pyruvate/2-oxoglutarate dehydrogenase complex dihydrolipoamide dehydrogenase (E3) component